MRFYFSFPRFLSVLVNILNSLVRIVVRCNYYIIYDVTITEVAFISVLSSLHLPLLYHTRLLFVNWIPYYTQLSILEYNTMVTNTAWLVTDAVGALFHTCSTSLWLQLRREHLTVLNDSYTSKSSQTLTVILLLYYVIFPLFTFRNFTPNLHSEYRLLEGLGNQIGLALPLPKANLTKPKKTPKSWTVQRT